MKYFLNSFGKKVGIKTEVISLGQVKFFVSEIADLITKYYNIDKLEAISKILQYNIFDDDMNLLIDNYIISYKKNPDNDTTANLSVTITEKFINSLELIFLIDDESENHEDFIDELIEIRYWGKMDFCIFNIK